jgi:nucleotidyltransferase AbiEii toxin of type IV toxin-antitoxin system
MADSVAISGWERAFLAAEKVKERLRRSTAALEKAGVLYAVVGGNAVAEWVGRVDEDAVRNTRDVDILIRRADLPAVKSALEPVGFLHCQSFGVDMFLDGPEGRPTSAVHLVFAGEPVRVNDVTIAPDITDSEQGAEFRVISLEALVRMKLTSFRDRDRMHLRDLIDVGQIDKTWPARLPPELAARLQQLLDNPNG